MEPVNNDTPLKDLYDSGQLYHVGADILRFWLVPFACFAAFGLPDRWGSLIGQFSRFAPLAFYILCGFFWAEGEDVGDETRPARTLRRTAGRFFLLFAVYLALNIAYYLLLGAPAGEMATQLLRKRTLFNFVVLCVWPFQMGETIWFIQSLFYVRVGLWLADKLHLMKLYKLVMVLAFAATLLTGELAGVVRFNFLGYSYLPANWLTCALPYVLLGRFVYEKQARLLSLPVPAYLALFALGVAAAYGEFTLLARYGLIAYTGHSVGFGLMALSLCCLFLDLGTDNVDFTAAYGRKIAWRVYAMSQPVALLLLFGSSFISPGLFSVVQGFGGLCVYLVCLPIASVVGLIAFRLRVRLGLAGKRVDDRQTLAEWLENENKDNKEEQP